MKLEQIWIYPIKSLPGIRVQNGYAGIRGLNGDRRYMLCDRNGKFISLREHKELYEFRVIKSGNDFEISHPSHNQVLILSAQPDSAGRQLEVSIWDDKVTGTEPFPDASSWFSEILATECRLIYMPEDSQRLVSRKWRSGNDLVSFADGYPYLVVSKASLQDISSSAGIEADPRRFRPNLVVTGAEPYAEFLWGSFQVGQAKFHGLKPCERCVVTTIDPDTLEKGNEPLLSLSRQKTDGRLVFGMHAAVASEGMISTGDKVVVGERKESPFQRV